MIRIISKTYCWLCQLPLQIANHGICSDCYRDLPRLVNTCPRCGLYSAVQNPICGRCLQFPPPWQTLVSCTPYTPPLTQLLQLFKQQNRSELAYPLARLMLLAWQMAYRTQALNKVDIIVPIPLSHHKRWRRGFNQSELLAQQLGHWLACPVDNHALVCTGEHPEQKRLPAANRRYNRQNAFISRQPLHEKNVLLIDDIVTTGSTIRAASHCLLNHGALAVHICCVCRTL